MKNDLFRKTAIDRVSSPDQLNDYIKIVPPGLWLVLAAIIIVIVGVLVFLSTTDLNLTQLIFG